MCRIARKSLNCDNGIFYFLKFSCGCFFSVVTTLRSHKYFLLDCVRDLLAFIATNFTRWRWWRWWFIEVQSLWAIPLRNLVDRMKATLFLMCTSTFYRRVVSSFLIQVDVLLWIVIFFDKLFRRWIVTIYVQLF